MELIFCAHETCKFNFSCHHVIQAGYTRFLYSLYSFTHHRKKKTLIDLKRLALTLEPKKKTQNKCSVFIALIHCDSAFYASCFMF